METFAQVLKSPTVHLLAFAAYVDLELLQMDVCTTFLNGIIIEDNYMTQMEGYMHKGKE